MPGDFIDLIAWQQAAELSREILDLTKKLRRPGAAGVADQMMRAADSIPANIAEGYGRTSGPDFARLLRVAYASATELESHLRQSVINRRLLDAEAGPLIERCRRVRALVRGLIGAVKRRKA